MRVILLNGIPVSLLVTYSDRYECLVYEEISKEKLRELMNNAEKIMNSIRHPSTKNLVLNLVEDKSKIEEVSIFDFNNLQEDDIVVVIAPKSVKERGKELEITWEDLAIFKIQLASVDWRSAYYTTFLR